MLWDVRPRRRSVLGQPGASLRWYWRLGAVVDVRRHDVRERRLPGGLHIGVETLRGKRARGVRRDGRVGGHVGLHQPSVRRRRVHGRVHP